MYLISAAIILAVDDTNALLLNETSGVCVITSLDSKSLDTIFLVLKKRYSGLVCSHGPRMLRIIPVKKNDTTPRHNSDVRTSHFSFQKKLGGFFFQKKENVCINPQL